MGSLSKVRLKLKNTKKSDTSALFLDDILSLLNLTIWLIIDK